MSYIHIHSPSITDRRVTEDECPTCKKKTTFYGWFQEWYGWHETCLECGEQWQEGEQLERPFERAWRKKNIEHAKSEVEKHGLSINN